MRYSATLALCLFLLGFSAPHADAGEQPLAVLPGGGMVFKPIISMRERRFMNLVEQKTDFSCGAASLATILNQAYRWNLSEEDVIQGMLETANVEQVREMGFSMLDMKNYLESIGLRARGYRIEVQQLPQIRVPVIVLIDIDGYKHFVVMQRSTQEWVYVGDPVLGHKRMGLSEFAQGWNGIVLAVIGPGYDRENALLDPPDPLTARDQVNRFAPLGDAELLEFGFIQSDFF